MKNFEKYEHQISKVVNEDNTLTCSIAFVSGIKKQKMCYLDDDCNECSKECLKWMHSEYKEQILTEEEKDIIRSMIDIVQKCGSKVVYVCKSCRYDNVFVFVNYKNELYEDDDIIGTPYVEDNMFKGMESEREYTPEELGITCQTQKDS